MQAPKYQRFLRLTALCQRNLVESRTYQFARLLTLQVHTSVNEVRLLEDQHPSD